jgi:hypothetical protein
VRFGGISRTPRDAHAKCGPRAALRHQPRTTGWAGRTAPRHPHRRNTTLITAREPLRRRVPLTRRVGLTRCVQSRSRARAEPHLRVSSGSDLFEALPRALLALLLLHALPRGEHSALLAREDWRRHACAFPLVVVVVPAEPGSVTSHGGQTSSVLLLP